MINQTKDMPKRLIALLVALSLIAVIFAGCTPTEVPEAEEPEVEELEVLEEPEEPEALAALDLGLRTDSPELFLEGALEISGLDVSGAFMDFAPDFSAFDLSRFRGRPTEHSFSISIDQADPTVLPIEGVGLNLRSLSDRAAGNYLLNFDVDAGFFALEDNSIFISPDMIALSAPDIYTRHRYISINPRTFAQDWNASGFAGDFGEIDPGDFEMILAMSEGMGEVFSFQALLDMLETYIEQSEQINQNLMNAGVFVDEGDTEITVGVNTYSVARLGYTFSEPALVEFMDALMGMIFEMVLELMDDFMAVAMIADPTLYEERDYLREEFMEILDEMSFSFPYGMTMYFYIDMTTGLVRRSSIQDWTMITDTGFGDEEMTTNIVTYYLGEVNVTDVTHTFVTMTDGFDDVIEMEIRLYIPEGGPYVFFMEMDMGPEGTFSFEMGYNPNVTTNNVWFEMEFQDRFTHVDFILRGDLVDSANEFAINNGNMAVVVDGTPLLGASFEYSLRNVAAGDVSIDRAQAVSLFDLDLAQLEQDLMMFAMMMAIMR